MGSRRADVLESQTANPSEVYFMASDDGGATWSQPSQHHRRRPQC
jgi:hypothetical protein